ncbi:hypothetical protein GCM10028784_35370 [Myceligenerans cantabricum]
MRTPIIAAAVAGTLLLSGCSVSAASADGTTSTPEPSSSGESRLDLAAPDTAIALSQEYDVIGACDAFFGGNQPLSIKARTLAPVVAKPLDPATTLGKVSKVSNQISSLIGLSPAGISRHLERIRTPFDQAKQGATARPQDVVTGIEAFKAECAQEGWTPGS